MCCVVIPVCMENPPPRSNGRSSFVCERGHGIIAASTKEVGFPCETKRCWSQRGGLKKGRWVGVAKLWSHRDLGRVCTNKTARKGKFARSSPRFQMRRTLRYISLYLLLHWQCDGRRTKNDSEQTPMGFLSQSRPCYPFELFFSISTAPIVKKA